MTARIIVADVLDGLSQLDDQSAQCVVTSPPYWGLRDYGVAGQIGLEATCDEYVERMVAVFSEVRRVLKGDGTLWLNLGDGHAMDSKWGGRSGVVNRRRSAGDSDLVPRRRRATGLKDKNLIGIPWLVAFALRDDGWWLRSDIVWHKPNPMPESVADRPTRSHEYVFLMTRARRYYYDADAIAEPSATDQPPRPVSGWASGPGSHHVLDHNAGTMDERRERSRALGDKLAEAPRDAVRSSASARMGRGAGWRDDPSTSPPTRNSRTVWTIATHAYPEAHFATFPPELARRCVAAGSKRGDLVLDPFAGSGTVGLVADRLGREFVGIELNPEYAAIAERRLRSDAPLFADVTVHVPEGA